MHLPANTGPLAAALPRLRVGYERVPVEQALGDTDVLAVIAFGVCGTHDPRLVAVGLEALGDEVVEVWRGRAPVRSGFDGALRWSSDGDYLFFAIEVDEAEAGGLTAAAEQAYRAVTATLDRHALDGGAPAQVLRLWNYLDAINEGEGDDERYRHFCTGRARGLGERARNGFSAATAIGRRDGVRRLQVYGLAARAPGRAVENPRQLSAWRYPREYGPTAPTFARAAVTAADQLLLSGTAAVVGHASQHVGDTAAQVSETLLNLDQLFAVAQRGSAADIGEHTVLKAYVREVGEAALVERLVRTRHPRLGGLVLLAGDICRRELRVEIDGVDG
ncbi:pteridine-dependent deoxygenase [Dokdonella sp.]|uniref:chorismate transformation enzyme, FkbO/Hyg5 family n=1 Tax=Dokdonella sp. TaxID=2291710 RepID=UPI0025BBAEBD|nr:pteridine-dependent deoxygenase [Dokdonella sp.]